MADDYPGNDVWHENGKVLLDNEKPSAANLALHSSEPDRDCFRFLHNRGARGVHVETSVATGGDAMGTSTSYTTLPAVNGVVPYIDVPEAKLGEVFRVDVTGLFSGADSGGQSGVRLLATQNYGGDIPTNTVMTHTAHNIHKGGGSFQKPVHFGGVFTCTIEGTLRFSLQVKMGDVVAGYCGIEEGERLTLCVTRHRPFYAPEDAPEE